MKGLVENQEMEERKNVRLTAGSVKIINCLSAVETRRFVLSSFKARAVISCPSPSSNTWKTCKRKFLSRSMFESKKTCIHDVHECNMPIA